MNVPSTSTRGYAKYQIRSSGMPRVLANESDVFTLDDVDVDEIDELKPNRFVRILDPGDVPLFQNSCVEGRGKEPAGRVQLGQ